MKDHQCLGRNKNWRRCGRYIHGKWFCDDHKKQPYILIIFIILTVIPAYITIEAYFSPQKSSNVYNVKNNFNYYNPAPHEIKKTFNATPTNRNKNTSRSAVKNKSDDSIKLQVYNSTSGIIEAVKPIEGKIYSTKTQTGGKIDYMAQDNKIFTDYTSPDGKIKSYFVSDPEGNVVDSKLPYDLDEYTVVVPPELELRRSERFMPNGWKSIHVDLKWGGKVDMVLDPNEKLQWVNIDGGVRVNHKLKTFVAGHTDKTNKWMLPNPYKASSCQ